MKLIGPLRGAEIQSLEDNMEGITNQEEMEMLNPQIKELTIGVRKLRTIKIYPLSASQQMELTDAISELYASIQGETTVPMFVLAIRDFIKKNFGKIVEMVSDEKAEDVLKDMSNVQLSDAIDMIYEMNFGVLEKKIGKFLQTIRGLFLQEKSPVQSSEVIPNIPLNTSLEEPSEKEGLQ
jgi:hypothetical protein